MMQIDVDSLHEGQNVVSVRGRDVILRCFHGQVQNVGYRLFSDDMRRAIHSPVLDFLERYFLQLDFPQPDRPSSRMAREDRFHFLKGSLSTVKNLRPDDDLSIDSDSRCYTVTWQRSGQTILSVHFPANHELISGETKIESEQNIEADILHAINHKEVNVNDADLSPTIQNGYLKKHGNTYLNRLFLSDLYYQRQNDTLFLVADDSHPLETTANMLVSRSFSPSRKMKMEQVLYGFKRKTFETTLRQWIIFCENSGCELYYGIESFDGQVVRATVLAVNTSENYNHVLLADIPMAAITDSSVPVSARLDAYVPMHNIKNLFGQFQNKSERQKKYVP